MLEQTLCSVYVLYSNNVVAVLKMPFSLSECSLRKKNIVSLVTTKMYIDEAETGYSVA